MEPVGVGGEGRGGCELGPLRLHLGCLPPLRLRELGSDDDEAEVDHEEGPNLIKSLSSS